MLSLNEALNAGKFPTVSAIGLRYLAENVPILRKPSEADCPYISYLPSFIQMVQSRLRLNCGLEIVSYPLNDGTGRKRYDIRPYRAEEIEKLEQG